VSSLTSSTSPPRLRAAGLALTGRLDRASGDAAAAISALRRSGQLWAELGALSRRASDAFVVAYTLVYDLRDLEGADAELRTIRRWPRLDPDTSMRLDYYEGIVATESGDLRRAIARFRAARASAERARNSQLLADAAQMEGIVLFGAGRLVEADRLFARVIDGSLGSSDVCRTALALTNRGWIRLVTRESGTGAELPPLDPVETFERAVDLRDGACRDVLQRANALTNLALAYLERGAVLQARAALDRAKQGLPRPDARIASWWLETEGRILLASGEARASLAVFERLQTLAAASLLPEAPWRASIGIARAREALGDTTGAARAFDEAEAHLDTDAGSVPLGEGRTTFFGRFAVAAREHVDFLFRAGRWAEAARTARRSRARLLEALRWSERIDNLSDAERARLNGVLADYRARRAALDAELAMDWTLPRRELEARLAERAQHIEQLRAMIDDAIATVSRGRRGSVELRAPREGELFLVYHPVRTGYAALALTSRSARGVAIPVLPRTEDVAALGERLFGSFRAELQAATQVRLYPASALEELDLHALPLDGVPLFEHANVSYGFDLGAPKRSEGTKTTAMVIGDPSDDLPASRAEAVSVARLLTNAAWTVDVRTGPDAAIKPLVAGLSSGSVSLLHYAGHGIFGGRDGWSSALRLAGGAELTVADVIALVQPPEVVVLSACETGRADAAATVVGLGVAQSFMVAGTNLVIATSRPVRDTTARLIADQLYTDLSGDWEVALGRALRAARAAGAPDWAAYRVFTR
jgi:tetratricopeptide (TPR) repeat protein